MLVAGSIAGSSILSGCGSDAPKKHIGLQLYSLRGDVKDLGIKKVLEIVAKMGYVNLETAGYNDGMFYNVKPREFKKMVDDLGMRATSSHAMRTITENRDEDMAWWSRAMEAHAAADMKYMVMPWAPFEDEEDCTLENVQRYGTYFNSIGKLTATVNIAFGYHNHAFEFKNKIDGVPVYDLLLENTSNHVFFQNDVYWTKVGGYDVVDYLKKYPTRHKTLHIKDVRDIGGSGTMNFEAIFNQAYENGIKDWYVEMEDERTPQEDVKKSYDFLAAAEYVK